MDARNLQQILGGRKVKHSGRGPLKAFEHRVWSCSVTVLISSYKPRFKSPSRLMWLSLSRFYRYCYWPFPVDTTDKPVLLFVFWLRGRVTTLGLTMQVWQCLLLPYSLNWKMSCISVWEIYEKVKNLWTACNSPVNSPADFIDSVKECQGKLKFALPELSSLCPQDFIHKGNAFLAQGNYLL